MIRNVEIRSDIIQIHPFTVQEILKLVLNVYLKFKNPFDIVSRKKSANFSSLVNSHFRSCQVKANEKRDPTSSNSQLKRFTGEVLGHTGSVSVDCKFSFILLCFNIYCV